MAPKRTPRDWATGRPKFRKSTVAKALNMILQNMKLKEIEQKTGIDSSYICRLSRRLADEQLPLQLQSEGARVAAIALLQREEKKLEDRLVKVKAALVRYGVVKTDEPSTT